MVGRDFLVSDWESGTETSQTPSCDTDVTTAQVVNVALVHVVAENRAFLLVEVAAFVTDSAAVSHGVKLFELAIVARGQCWDACTTSLVVTL